MVVLPLILGCAADAARVHGAVASDHPLASEAGATVLKQGGNAVDAAIAAALSSGVVQPTGSGLGGGGFALVVPAEGNPTILDFREVAPTAATRDMYAGGASSTLGGLAVAVPAEGIGLAELHRRFGRIGLKKIVAPAYAQAAKGFEPGRHLKKALLESPDMAGLFAEGNKRPGLADALKAWAETKGEAFRTGWVAQDFVDSARDAGGILTMTDLAAYRVVEREPLVAEWRGNTVYSMPPPSSGGIALLQMLRATEGVPSTHCAVEAAKHAMADRAATGGDPGFVTVDVKGLLADPYVTSWRADCVEQTWPAAHYGMGAAPTDHGTLHISVVDGEGNAVALTTTINLSFGSHVISKKSGIVLNDEMDDFTTRPGQPNGFGLIQGENNAIAPGKRPLSSMSPTVVVGPDLRLAIGASGGPTIITSTFQVLKRVMDGEAPEAAVAAKRWHHQWQPETLFVEPGFPGQDELTAHGHVVQERPAFSAVQVAIRKDGTWAAASEARKGGEARAF